MLSEEQQKKLQELLLTPIKVDKLATSIKKEGDIIISTQTYKRAADPDMSDLSVLFYEIIYKDILPKNQNNENKVLGNSDEDENLFASPSFAGDTMSSFNTIAGKVIKKLEIDSKSIKKYYYASDNSKGRLGLIDDSEGKLQSILDSNVVTPIAKYFYMPKDSEGRLRLILDSNAEDNTKQLFHRFYDLYHSLANFWIIPMKMGRNSRKTVFGVQTQDYMEKFLSEIKNNWSDLKTQDKCYFEKFSDYSEFTEKHFITETDYLESAKDTKGIRSSLEEKIAVKIVSGIIHAIENRAVLLSKSEEYGEQLWNLLNDISTDNSEIQ